MSAVALIESAAAEICRPWLRHILPAADWARLAEALAGDELVLLAHWADTVQVHALFLDETRMAAMAVSAPVEQGGYAALSPGCPGAAWYERMVWDLWGHAPIGGLDARPWLDHGHWPVTRPLSPRPEPPPPSAEPPEPRGAPEAGIMQVPLGPVDGLIAAPAHLRLTLDGTRVESAESRLGYAHRGVLALMRGKSPRVAARFAARLAGDATVAHSIAFAAAAEAALDVAAAPRGVVLRMVMAELERIAGHLAMLGAIAAAIEAESMRLAIEERREHLARGASTAFGHRLMMDCVVPGGVVVDIAAGGAEAILRAMGGVASSLPALRQALRRFDIAERLDGLGIAPPALVRRFGVGGIAGRSAGRGFDARTFAPEYGRLGHAPASATQGDIAARCRIALAEIGESLRLLGLLLQELPTGPTTVALPSTSGEGIGCAESHRGDIWTWLRLDHGQIAAAFLRDPAWAAWPLAEYALAGSAFEDIALIRASLGLTVAGMDL